MELSRRDLAVAGALAFAFGATSLGAMGLVGPALAQSGDEAAVKKAVEDMRKAWVDKDKAKLEAMTLPQLTYSHSDGRIEDKAKFIEGAVNRKSTTKSLEFPEMTVAVVGDTAIVRHLLVSESELDGKTTNIRIGVTQVYKKQDGNWKLLARTAYRLPEKA
jgi:ketosteroid isomerase-like protein